MNDIYQIIIEFKTLHPLRFWAGIAIAVLLLILVSWKLFKRKRKNAKTEPESKVEKQIHHEKYKATENKFKRVDISKTETKNNLTYSQETTQIIKVEDKQTSYKSQTEDIIAKKHEPFIIIKKTEEVLPKAKIETEKKVSDNIFINYESKIQNNTDFYPILRFPPKACVIRTHRHGSTKRRGFKERVFQTTIERYYSNILNISGDTRLNTGKKTRPFEPDISIIDLKSGKNIRIDIEIDEPYAGISRQATHCKGEDFVRDSYFVDRGWIVIRFSEFQVHTFEKQCLKFIGKVIQSIDSNFSIPSELLQVADLEHEKQWDIVQAQKWERQKYRENYLNHTFQNIEEEPETIERDFNEQEINEEKLVESSLIGKIDSRKNIGYNKANSHPRDLRINFYPTPHIYTIDNTPAPSASTVIGKFFPEFDSEYWSNKKSVELGMTPDVVSLMWKTKGAKAALEGTILHEQIENYYLSLEYLRTEEFHLFEQFVDKHKNLKPYRTEWRVFDEHYHIAGTIDLIVKNGNEFEIYDWKRSKKVITPHNGEPIRENQWQRGVGQLQDIADTSFNRYCLQQSLYRYILEKNYSLTVSKMYLVVLYPGYDCYYKVEVPYQKDKVEYILRTL